MPWIERAEAMDGRADGFASQSGPDAVDGHDDLVHHWSRGGAKRGKARLNLHLLFTCLRRPDGL